MLNSDADRRDLLWLQLEDQAATRNCNDHSYHWISGRKVVRFMREVDAKPPLAVALLVAFLSSLGWLQRHRM